MLIFRASEYAMISRRHDSLLLKAGAVCGSSACTDLCGGCQATGIPTATGYMVSMGMKGSVTYNLEIKSWPDKTGIFHPPPARYAALVLQLVEAAGLSLRVRIQSFDYLLLREAWRLNPLLCYGFLIDEAKDMDRILCELDFLPRYVNPHFSLVDREMRDALHEQGIGMIPWTVNRTEEMLAMEQIGAEGIITDYPGRAIALFGVPE